MLTPEGQFHLETSSSVKSEHEYRVIDSNDYGNNNCTADFERISFSDDENEDKNELN